MHLGCGGNPQLSTVAQSHQATGWECGSDTRKDSGEARTRLEAEEESASRADPGRENAEDTQLDWGEAWEKSTGALHLPDFSGWAPLSVCFHERALMKAGALRDPDHQGWSSKLTEN